MDSQMFLRFCYTRSMRILAVSLMVAVVSFTPLRAQQTGGSIDLPAAVNVVLRVEGAGVQIYTCTSTPA